MKHKRKFLYESFINPFLRCIVLILWHFRFSKSFWTLHLWFLNEAQPCYFMHMCPCTCAKTANMFPNMRTADVDRREWGTGCATVWVSSIDFHVQHRAGRQVASGSGYGEPLVDGSAELRPLEEEEEVGLWLGAELEKVNSPLGPAGGAWAAADAFTPAAAAADFWANRVPVNRNVKNQISSD